MNKTLNSIRQGVNKNPIIIASLGLFVIMLLFVPRFATLGNFISLSGQISYLGIATVGLAFVLVGGGIDLSLGSVISITGVVTALMIVAGLPILVAVLIALLLGAAIGLLNGFFIAVLGVNAFMMTLITQMLFEGIALIVTEAQSITGLPAVFVEMWYQTILYIPVPVLIMLFFFIIGHIVLTKSVFGRRLFVTGANKKAAKLVGVKADTVQMTAFIFSGLMGAIAGVILTSRLGVGSPAAGSNIILDIVSAAVIGGNSLFGGKGSIIGAAFGVLLLGLISNGLSLLGVEWAHTMIVKGAVILLAVIIDVVNSKVAQKQMLTV
ncbi:MAG: ABC transporter permease [Defluviitaleaceae bacterium]|nr:ABC transporter permease [Defluviitaleaceae bacterium]